MFRSISRRITTSQFSFKFSTSSILLNKNKPDLIDKRLKALVNILNKVEEAQNPAVNIAVFKEVVRLNRNGTDIKFIRDLCEPEGKVVVDNIHKIILAGTPTTPVTVVNQNRQGNGD